MSGIIRTLKELCLEKVASLCSTSYWNPKFLNRYNPFDQMPSLLIDSVIINICQTSKAVDSCELHLPLTSGRVENFILENVALYNPGETFLDLATACQNLEKIRLRNVYTCPKKFSLMTEFLGNLVGEARNIKEIESCIEFDLQKLRDSTKLQNLILDFPVQGNNVFDFLKVNSQNSLKQLKLREKTDFPISYKDIAVVLQYATELTEIYYDISKSLQYLHSKEFMRGNISARYKLKSCYLGNIYFRNYLVTKDIIHIASLTCPDLEDLCIVVNIHQVIGILNKFHKIKFLQILWNEIYFGDYTCGVQLLLEKTKFGNYLVYLDLMYFSNIDFSSIGKCCPNLEVLKAVYDYEKKQTKFLPNSFKKLKLLLLRNVEHFNCNADTLVGILSQATELNSITIHCAGEFTDAVLNDILNSNNLVKLTNLSFEKCVLSPNGIRKLVFSLKSLEYFHLSETFNVDEISHIIKEINPRVIVSSSFKH